MASECNRCYYPIQWNKDLAQSLFEGRNRPFKPGTQEQHQCITPPRPGWGIGSTGKPGIVNPDLLSDEDKQELIDGVETPTAQKRVAAVMKEGQTTLSSSVSPDIQVKIDKILKQQEALAAAFTETVSKQNNDIHTLKAIIDEYIAHNPFAEAMNKIVTEFIKSKSVNTEPQSAYDMMGMSDVDEERYNKETDNDDKEEMI